MATISTDTAIEDLFISSGETFTFSNNAVLTISTDVSQYTALKATGTGTIRLLNGGKADFSGTNPMPSTITIEGGTAANPLPAHGDYGYHARAAAEIILGGRNPSDSDSVDTRIGNAHQCKIISHCAGNWDRQQFAKVVSSTSSTIVLDRDMALEAGDVIGWTNGMDETQRKQITVGTYDSNTITHSSGITVTAGGTIVLLTAGFAVGSPDYMFGTKGEVEGDEICFMAKQAGRGSILYGPTFLQRATNVWNGSYYICTAICGLRSPISIGVCVTMGGAIGERDGGSGKVSNNTARLSSAINIGLAVGGVDHTWSNNYGYDNAKVRICGGRIFGKLSYLVCNEYVDTELPSELYSTLAETSEFIVRTTSPETCVIHRSNGLATLLHSGDDTPMTGAPVRSAYLLQPESGESNWHDVPVTVPPQGSVTAVLNAYLVDATAGGLQILDGDYPAFGQVKVPMGAADVLAEAELPSGSATGAWLPAVRVTWRNDTDQPKKVVLRGWADGEAYVAVRAARGGQL